PAQARADYQGRRAGARVKGPRGLIVSIAECEPGNGPGLHRHLNPVENFLCLSGRFEIAWGDQGEHRLVLDPLDMISVPRGENRSFRNISDETARLLILIVPETDEQSDPISYAVSLAKEIENAYETVELAGLQKIGFKFECEATTYTTARPIPLAALEHHVNAFGAVGHLRDAGRPPKPAETMCDANLLPTMGHNSSAIMSAPTSSGCRGWGTWSGPC